MIARLVWTVALAVAVLAAVAPAPARAVQVGIAADALLLHGDDAEVAEAIAEWRRLGIDTVRLQVNWARVAPTPEQPVAPPGFSAADHEDPGYAWGSIDRAVRRIVAGGLKPILMLDGPPPLWASTHPGAGNPRFQPASWQFAAFAQAAAARYGSQVDEYILWNEPNLPVWLQPQARCKGRSCTPISPHLYRYMVRAAYPAIHAADGRARVLVGALAPAGANLKSRNANMRPLQFLRAFACVNDRLWPVRTGPCRTFEPAIADGFAYHPHSTKHPPDEPYPRVDDVGMASLDRLTDLLDVLQATKRIVGTTQPLGLWLDEYGYQTNPPDKLRGVTPGRQDRYLQHAAYVAWRNPRVRLLAQYLWRDEPAGGGKRYTGWQSGLLTHEGRPKPALAHFAHPFWIDYRRNLLWGQVRPGDAHEVHVQIRPPGTSTSWQPLADVRTAADGSWVLRRELVPYASYRAVAEGGQRTAVMVAAPPRDPGHPEPRDPGDDPLLERRTAATVGGAPVPRSFAGLSIEYDSIPDYLGANGQVNPVFAGLMDTLARAGNGPPTLRFGGDSTENTWWNPDGALRPPGIVTDATPAWMDHLAAWQAAARTPLVMGLNLALNDPGRAAAMAAAAQARLPAGSIAAFEIGNEPDLFATPRTYWVGKRLLNRSQKRPAGYDYAQYRDELAAHVAAVRAAVPGAPLSAAAFAASSWDDHAHDLLEHQRAVRNYGTHAYPLQTCDPAIRRRGSTYIRKLLAPSATASIVKRMRPLVDIAASHGAVVRLTEVNSAICGGLRGTSDTFASALWSADLLFGLADAGVRSVSFHTWTGSIYGALDFTQRAGRPAARVRPLFYGMLLFSRAAPPGARLLDVGPNPAGEQLKTWGTIDRAGTRRIVVINKDSRRPRTVELTVPGGAGRATVQRLQAPLLRSQNNVRLAGQGYGGATSDGRLAGRPKQERLANRSGRLTLAMPAGSAALVEVRAR